MTRRAIYCSFCGRTEHEVDDLVAGPAVYICGECIGLAQEIVTAAQERRAKQKAQTETG